MGAKDHHTEAGAKQKNTNIETVNLVGEFKNFPIKISEVNSKRNGSHQIKAN